MNRTPPKAGREFKDYHSYVPFDTVTVIEQDKQPVLYDPSGKPLGRIRRIGFDTSKGSK